MLLMFIVLVVSFLSAASGAYTVRRFPFLSLICTAVAIGLQIAVSFRCFESVSLGLALATGYFGIFRIFNNLRIIYGIHKQAKRWQDALVTDAWLVLAEVVVFAAAKLLAMHLFPRTAIWTVVCLLQLGLALTCLYVVRHHKDVAFRPVDSQVPLGQLPTVSVLIAARNETEELMRSLQSLVASTYPKLEIIVLDDCSQTRRTPDIIRQFAHDGVRFIPGSDSPDSWLARNHAFATLAAAASGSLLLFSSTAVVYEPDAITKMVRYCVAGKKQMLSVLPHYETSSDADIWFEPMRAAWELMPPRKLVKRPAIASSCWLIDRSSLQKFGGFKAVSHMLSPEAYFARRTAEHDGYSFVAGAGSFGITSHRSSPEHWERAVRNSYPSLHRRPEIVALFAFLIPAAGLAPLIQIVAAGLSGSFLDCVLSAITFAVLLWAYVTVIQLVYGGLNLRATAAYPISIILAAITMLWSMYRYEFTEVFWKQRNICVPVMEVIPRLPRF